MSTNYSVMAIVNCTLYSPYCEGGCSGKHVLLKRQLLIQPVDVFKITCVHSLLILLIYIQYNHYDSKRIAIFMSKVIVTG